MKDSAIVRTRWSREALAAARINAVDSEYMEAAGLPHLEADELVFSADTLGAVHPGTDCHRVGTYGALNDVPLFVRESEPGIWTTDEETEEPSLVNSSARAFSQFVALRRKYLLDMERHLPPQVRPDLVLLVQKAMAVVDGRAMAGSCLWPPFLEDMYNQAQWYEDE